MTRGTKEDHTQKLESVLTNWRTKAIKPAKRSQNFTKKKRFGWNTPSHRMESDQIMKKNRCHQLTKHTDEDKNTEIILRSNTVFHKTNTEPIRKDEQHETIIEKRNKMGMNGTTKHRFQQLEKRADDTTVFSTLQRQQRKHRYNRRMQYRIRNSAMATTKQRRIESNRICKMLPKRCRKKYSVGELELLAVVWGLERFSIYLYGKQIQLFSDHQSLEPLLKRNKTNKQNSARLTRWLDRLNHFDVSLKYTAGKEIKFTNFISRNPTETAEPEENYEKRICHLRHRATCHGEQPNWTDFRPIREH